MTPEPRRKDGRRDRELSEGAKSADEGADQAAEEYTSYREVAPEKHVPGEAEADREATLQPGSPDTGRAHREQEARREGGSSEGKPSGSGASAE